MRVDGKKTSEISIFKNYSRGVATSRDVWVYGSDKQKVLQRVGESIKFYNSQVEEASKNPKFEIDLDPQKMKWDFAQRNGLEKGKKASLQEVSHIYKSYYRPFFSQFLYFDRFWNNRVYQMPAIFPTNEAKNLVICSSGVDKKDNLVICINQNAKDAGQIALMTNQIADLHFNGDTQCFPRWLPGESPEKKDSLDFGQSNEIPSGFSKEALPHFQAAYPGKAMTEDDLFYYIYGLLHSEDYRTKYANNLMKELPRIPRVATYEQFRAFAQAGRKLVDLHVNFESVEPYSEATIEFTKDGAPSYRVTQMKWAKIKGKTGNVAKDKSTLIYNEWITVKNVPLEAQEYIVNKKSALDWVVERACVSIDKASGIVNDFNDYAAEQGNERYPLELFLKVITVSLETMKIVHSLPSLDIHPLDRD